LYAAQNKLTGDDLDIAESAIQAQGCGDITVS